MKTCELIGDDLDYWTAKAQGWEQRFNVGETQQELIDGYTPSTNGAQAMNLVEQNPMCIQKLIYSKGYYALVHGEGNIPMIGDTAKVAICRAKVASVFGEEVRET